MLISATVSGASQKACSDVWRARPNIRDRTVYMHLVGCVASLHLFQPSTFNNLPIIVGLSQGHTRNFCGVAAPLFDLFLNLVSNSLTRGPMRGDQSGPSNKPPRESVPFQQSSPSIPAFSEEAEILPPGYIVLGASASAYNVSATHAPTPIVHIPSPRFQVHRIHPVPFISKNNELSPQRLLLREIETLHSPPSLLPSPQFTPGAFRETFLGRLNSTAPSTSLFGEHPYVFPILLWG